MSPLKDDPVSEVFQNDPQQQSMSHTQEWGSEMEEKPATSAPNRGSVNAADSSLDWMDTAEMQQAMGVLRQFSEGGPLHHIYQSRLKLAQQQQAVQKEIDSSQEEKLAALEQEKAALQREAAAVQEKEMALQEKDAALAELERLNALLRG